MPHSPHHPARWPYETGATQGYPISANTAGSLSKSSRAFSSELTRNMRIPTEPSVAAPPGTISPWSESFFHIRQMRTHGSLLFPGHLHEKIRPYRTKQRNEFHHNAHTPVVVMAVIGMRKGLVPGLVAQLGQVCTRYPALVSARNNRASQSASSHPASLLITSSKIRVSVSSSDDRNRWNIILPARFPAELRMRIRQQP